MAKMRKSHDVDPVSQLVESGDAETARKAIDSHQAAEMRRAAKVIETSAFELAGLHPGNLIGQLIIIAADIERIAQSIESDQPVAHDPEA